MDENKITVAVCGDSFCAASRSDLQVTGAGVRAHFSQMLEDVYNYRVLYFAHGGFSNVGILFQIRQAIIQQAQVIVYTNTWSDRLELYTHDRLHVNLGLKNFFYYNPDFESSATPWVGTNSSPVISTTASNIDHSPFYTISSEQKKAIDLYFKYLYNDDLQTEIDKWLFDYWHLAIEKSGALPIRFKDPCIGKIAYDFSHTYPTYDTPFHTDRATQERVAANIHEYIKKHWKPCSGSPTQ